MDRLFNGERLEDSMQSMRSFEISFYDNFDIRDLMSAPIIPLSGYGGHLPISWEARHSSAMSTQNGSSNGPSNWYLELIVL